MFNTSKLSPGGTARYPLPDLKYNGQETCPALLVRHSSYAWDALKVEMARRGFGKAPSDESTDPTVKRVEDAATMAKCTLAVAAGVLIVGWENFYEQSDDGAPALDESGNPRPLEFTVDRCKALLALIDERAPIERDQLSAFLGSRTNFTGQSAVDVAKNS
jgi:hypothetical protein